MVKKLLILLLIFMGVGLLLSPTAHAETTDLTGQLTFTEYYDSGADVYFQQTDFIEIGYNVEYLFLGLLDLDDTLESKETYNSQILIYDYNQDLIYFENITFAVAGGKSFIQTQINFIDLYYDVNATLYDNAYYAKVLLVQSYAYSDSTASQRFNDNVIFMYETTDHINEVDQDLTFTEYYDSGESVYYQLSDYVGIGYFTEYLFIGLIDMADTIESKGSYNTQILFYDDSHTLIYDKDIMFVSPSGVSYIQENIQLENTYYDLYNVLYDNAYYVRVLLVQSYTTSDSTASQHFNENVIFSYDKTDLVTDTGWSLNNEYGSYYSIRKTVDLYAAGVVTNDYDDTGEISQVFTYDSLSLKTYGNIDSYVVFRNRLGDTLATVNINYFLTDSKNEIKNSVIHIDLTDIYLNIDLVDSNINDSVNETIYYIDFVIMQSFTSYIPDIDSIYTYDVDIEKHKYITQYRVIDETYTYVISDIDDSPTTDRLFIYALESNYDNQYELIDFVYFNGVSYNESTYLDYLSDGGLTLYALVNKTSDTSDRPAVSGDTLNNILSAFGADNTEGYMLVFVIISISIVFIGVRKGFSITAMVIVELAIAALFSIFGLFTFITMIIVFLTLITLFMLTRGGGQSE